MQFVIHSFVDDNESILGWLASVTYSQYRQGVTLNNFSVTLNLNMQNTQFKTRTSESDLKQIPGEEW